MARTVGSKNTKYRGIPIDVFDVATVSSMIAELEHLKREVSWYSKELAYARDELCKLENRSWIQRLFNLKG